VSLLLLLARPYSRASASLILPLDLLVTGRLCHELSVLLHGAHGAEWQPVNSTNH
jgi:hypothetical protein